MRGTLRLACIAVLVASSTAAAVPTTLGFSARLIDDKTDTALTGKHRISFELFDAELAGTSVWQEGREVTIDDGLLFTDVGQNKPLDGAVFDGRKLWLEVKLDDVTMEPRVVIDSVPYAIHAGDADTLAGMTTEDLQARVTGSCGDGSFMIAVKADGSLVCAPDLTGSGDITGITTGSGLMGGAAAGDVSISLINTCAPTELLKWNGTAWGCATDANAGGDITSVTIGPAGGLTGGGTTGDLTLALIGTCGFGQLLKWNGSSWNCGNDLDTDTNSGGDITGVLVNGSSGLVGGASVGDAALSLLTSCGMGQLLKWNGSAWGCANDLDTDTDTNSGGDVTEVVAGAGLVGGGVSGAVTVDVAAGTGLTVSANQIALDQAFTDGRYVNATGDTMSGVLSMAGNRITGRGCLAGYVAVGPGLCTEDGDAFGFTFSACANRCRAAGSHMCSSAEMRSVMLSGITLSQPTLLDWIDDQDADDSALYVAASDGNNPDQVRPTTTSSYCRCCQNVE